MAEKKRIDAPTGTETVGHEWDGIEELDTPMPRWWLITLYATIVWSIGYVIAFPAWPLINSATEGLLGWSSRGELAKEMQSHETAMAPIRAAIASTPIDQLPSNPQLFQQAVAGGASAFKANCVQCHGSGAAGSKGYPNLNDDDWLWGGDIASIHTSIAVGIRQPDADDTRTSMMPAFGKDGILKPEQVDEVVAYVRTISRQEPASVASSRGAKIFADNCASCHGVDGKGARTVGAPNLTDAVWLYGGDKASIRETVNYSHAGVMPKWAAKLDPVTVKMLAAYVYSLGGGEAKPNIYEPAQQPAAPTVVAMPAAIAAPVAKLTQVKAPSPTPAVKAPTVAVAEPDHARS